MSLHSAFRLYILEERPGPLEGFRASKSLAVNSSPSVSSSVKSPPALPSRGKDRASGLPPSLDGVLDYSSGFDNALGHGLGCECTTFHLRTQKVPTQCISSSRKLQTMLSFDYLNMSEVSRSVEMKHESLSKYPERSLHILTSISCNWG